LKIHPLPGNIFAVLQTGSRTTAGGIILQDDNGKQEGIRPRWAKVWKIASDIKDVEVGQWILVEHGRWTMTITVKDDSGNDFKFQKIDPAGIMLVSDNEPNEEMFGESFDLSNGIRAEDFGAR
jgi:hypothetical protein